jgi:hypothetical protein
VAAQTSDSNGEGRWIVSPGFDLFWFFGGAGASVLLVVLFLAARVPIVPLVWVGILLFDGPHMAAAYTRTYLDAKERRERRRVLLVPLVAFAIGPLCLALDAAIGSEVFFLGFLGGASFYAYYHVVRQHYGFLALYKARGRERSRIDFLVDKWSLYVACFVPYVYFLVTHPKARVLIHLAPQASPSFVRAVAIACALVWGAAVVAFAWRALASRAGATKIAYFLLTVALYAAAYGWIGRMEPVYAASNGPDQDFLLLGLVIGVFHNMQYVGLVWFHNRNRYAGPDRGHGLARAVSGSPVRYFAAVLGFSAIYYLIACSTGVYPGCAAFLGRRLGPFTINQLGLCAWWGIALHHYVLDQKIWRIAGDPELRKNLGLT